MDPTARIGTTLKGKWRIDRLLGTGGFASVYAATHRAGKRVAIKVLHAALGASEEVRRRFLREAYAANAVEHPAVVGVSDDDVTEDGAPFLVMDLLDGETAEGRRKKAGGTLGADEVMGLAEEVLGALAVAHAKGIVHRDLKPENLFVTTDGHVKILDFGIARFREPGDEATATQTGLTMGSPAFMAPEQARGRWSEVDARTDVYSLGATMFVLLSGRLVHGKKNLNEALIDAATKPAPPLASAVAGISPAVAAVVDRALAFEKEKRWADAIAMRDAVRMARAAGEYVTSTLPLGAIAAVGTPSGDANVSSGSSMAGISDTAGAGGISPSIMKTAQLPPPALQQNTEIASAAALPGSTTTSSPVVTTQPPGAKSRTLVVVVALATMAIAVVAIVVWSSVRGAPEPSSSAMTTPEVSPSISVEPTPASATSQTAAPIVAPDPSGSTSAATAASQAPDGPASATAAAPSAAVPPSPATPPASAATSSGATKTTPKPSGLPTSTKSAGDDLRSIRKRY
ncbi:MAG: serine/threonine-protein kinase [Polyangiaceae bacterium]